MQIADRQSELQVAMDESQFWELVQRAHDAAGDDMDRKGQILKSEISRLSKNDALDFADLFDAMMAKAYSYDLWGAAYIINGGCGDDMFSDFRASLISRGQESFQRAVSNPDSLADEQIDEEVWFYEGYQYDVTDGVKSVAGSRPKRRIADDPSGRRWEEAELRTLYPKLAARFPHHVM
jgi:Protein of unknown function (DUF4240)